MQVVGKDEAGNPLYAGYGMRPWGVQSAFWSHCWCARVRLMCCHR